MLINCILVNWCRQCVDKLHSCELVVSQYLICAADTVTVAEEVHKCPRDSKDIAELYWQDIFHAYAEIILILFYNELKVCSKFNLLVFFPCATFLPCLNLTVIFLECVMVLELRVTRLYYCLVVLGFIMR